MSDCPAQGSRRVGIFGESDLESLVIAGNLKDWQSATLVAALYPIVPVESVTCPGFFDPRRLETMASCTVGGT